MKDERVTLSLKHKAVVAVALVLLVLCAVSAVFGSGGVVDLRGSRPSRRRSRRRSTELTQQNDQLRDHLARKPTPTTPIWRSWFASGLGWIKPGERVYQVTNEHR
ncbi:MAG: hypothetical protein U0802_23840 [Candidatus Binatia bacterium]